MSFAVDVFCLPAGAAFAGSAASLTRGVMRLRPKIPNMLTLTPHYADGAASSLPDTLIAGSLSAGLKIMSIMSDVVSGTVPPGDSCQAHAAIHHAFIRHIKCVNAPGRAGLPSTFAHDGASRRETAQFSLCGSPHVSPHRCTPPPGMIQHRLIHAMPACRRSAGYQGPVPCSGFRTPSFCVSAAALGAVFHLVPVLRPFAPPGHGLAARCTGLAGQRRFIAWMGRSVGHRSMVSL